MNRYLQGAHVPEWMTKGKPHWSKWTQTKKPPPKLQTYNLPIDDMENINSPNKGRDLLLISRLFPEKQERCRKGYRGTAELLYMDQQILNERKDHTKKISYGLDWLQKGIWNHPAKLDNKLPQNVQNITWSHKLYRENLESGIDSMRKKLSWS